MKLILLKTGGHIIYSGPVGQHSDKVIEYFQVSLLFSGLRHTCCFKKIKFLRSARFSFLYKLDDRGFLGFKRSKITTIQQHGC